jgi:hypothetical protein
MGLGLDRDVRREARRFLLEVMVHERVPLAVEGHAAPVERGLGARPGPGHPGALHPVLDDVAAGALDHAGGDGVAGGQIRIVVKAVAVAVERAVNLRQPGAGGAGRSPGSARGCRQRIRPVPIPCSTAPGPTVSSPARRRRCRGHETGAPPPTGSRWRAASRGFRPAGYPQRRGGGLPPGRWPVHPQHPGGVGARDRAGGLRRPARERSRPPDAVARAPRPRRRPPAAPRTPAGAAEPAGGGPCRSGGAAGSRNRASTTANGGRTWGSIGEAAPSTALFLRSGFGPRAGSWAALAGASAGFRIGTP